MIRLPLGNDEWLWVRPEAVTAIKTGGSTYCYIWTERLKWTVNLQVEELLGLLNGEQVVWLVQHVNSLIAVCSSEATAWAALEKAKKQGLTVMDKPERVVVNG